MTGIDEALLLDGHLVEISNPGKILFPEDSFTKKDLVEYYRRVAEVALPHYRNRPVTMQRYPDGIGSEGFFQKTAPDYFPDWIATVTLRKEDGTITQPVVNDAATLVFLANQGCITPHLSLFQTDDVDHPDRLVFDLDPSDDDFSKVRQAARRVKSILDKLELECFLQTTGSRGLHVIVPIQRTATFDEVRDLAHRLGKLLESRYPKEMTVAQRKNKRGNLVFIDYLRNAYGQTTVAPYAVRSKAGAPVATPIDWRELGNSALNAQRYNIQNIFRRLGNKPDPWAEIDKSAQTLSEAMKKLRRMESK